VETADLFNLAKAAELKPDLRGAFNNLGAALEVRGDNE
jgi:hypothetical protein